MGRNKRLSKYLIPAFYAAVMGLMVFYAWNEQIQMHSSGSGPFYRNLMDSPAWIRRGFDPTELNTVPLDWALFGKKTLRVKDAPLSNLPRRRFLSPFGNADEEFTIIFPIEMDSGAMA
ncbi:MAG: hypothetical protein LBH42_04005 [Treponema sp.]|nr:hypothetical protein [Treponema sp.]